MTVSVIPSGVEGSALAVIPSAVEGSALAVIPSAVEGSALAVIPSAVEGSALAVIPSAVEGSALAVIPSAVEGSALAVIPSAVEGSALRAVTKRFTSRRHPTFDDRCHAQPPGLPPHDRIHGRLGDGAGLRRQRHASRWRAHRELVPRHPSRRGANRGR